MRLQISNLKLSSLRDPHGRIEEKALAAVLVCIALAAFATTSAAASQNAPSTIADDVRQNIQALLKSDAASIAPPAKPVKVTIPKLPETIPAIVKKPPPASQPTSKPVVVAKVAPATKPAADSELEGLRAAKLDNPLAAADSFYKAGKLVEAAILYEHALAKAKDSDKDWVLLQLGACTEPADPQAAMKWYGRLIAECPGSNWAGVAKARQGVLQFLVAQDVHTVLKNSAPGKTK